MGIEQIEELIRKYLSAGITVVLVIIAPGTSDGRGERPAEPSVTVIEPDASAPDLDRTGAGGRDPDAGDDPPSGGTRPEDPPRSRPEQSADGRPGTGRDPDPDRQPDQGSRGGDRAPSSDPAPGSDGTGSDADRDETGGDGTDRTETDRSGTGGSGSDRTGTGGDETGGSGADRTGPDRIDTGPTDTDTDTSGGEPGAAADASTSEGTTAAAVHGWGTPVREDDFAGALGEGWNVYDGPGHADNGRRTPDAVSVRDGVLTITGDARGSTAGMAWEPGQKYGRWEGRVRAPASDETYNALLLLWPDAEDFPVGGEIDFMEMMDHTRRTTDIFIHYGEDNSQVNGQVEVDGTRWHNWALEWTPESITAYVDGEEWYRTTDTSIFPPGPMHLCIQLDWFPDDAEGEVQESYMHVDWVRQYALDSAAPDTGSDTGSDTGRGRSGGGNPAPRQQDDQRDDDAAVREWARRQHS